MRVSKVQTRQEDRTLCKTRRIHLSTRNNLCFNFQDLLHTSSLNFNWSPIWTPKRLWKLRPTWLIHHSHGRGQQLCHFCFFPSTDLQKWSEQHWIKPSVSLDFKNPTNAVSSEYLKKYVQAKMPVYHLNTEGKPCKKYIYIYTHIVI